METVLITREINNTDVIIAADMLVKACHGVAKESGWWNQNDKFTSMENPLHFSNKLMLIVSELAEAMEGDRKNLMDDKLPQYPMRVVELADALIRACDLAGGYGFPLGEVIAAKLAYNAKRADHKPENRAAEGGKTY